MSGKGKTVLVTGGTGYVGQRCVLHALQEGYEVRATMRNLSAEKEASLRESLKKGGLQAAEERLKMFEADILAESGWLEAMAGCDYVLHVASPFPAKAPKDLEGGLYRPAKEGTLRVLKFAKEAGVKRVVITSSVAAVAFGQEGKVFTEEDWSDDSRGQLVPYNRSKLMAERAAWDYVKGEGAGLELVTICPPLVCGPVLTKSLSTSVQVLQNIMNGAYPIAPEILFGLVDVRDVADIHLKAMVHPEANGQRYIVASQMMPLLEVTRVLSKRFGKPKSPAMRMPIFVAKLLALFVADMRSARTELGRVYTYSTLKAEKTFNWKPIPAEELLYKTGEDLMKLGLVG